MRINIYVPIRDRWELGMRSLFNLLDSVPVTFKPGGRILCCLDNDPPEDFTLGWADQPWPRKIGIEAQRVAHVIHAAAEDVDYAYFTDADAVHLEDPRGEWLDTLIALHTKTGKVVSGYRTKAHDHDFIADHGDWVEHKHPAGISVLLGRDQIRALADGLATHGHTWFTDTSPGWDWAVTRCLGTTAAVTAQSLVQHIGDGGMHHRDGNPDIALNPHPNLPTSEEWKAANL